MCAFRSRKTEWEPHHDLLYLILTNHAIKVGKVVLLILAMERVQALSRDSKRIRDSNSDSAGAYIKAKNAMLFRRIQHEEIIRCIKIGL